MEIFDNGWSCLYTWVCSESYALQNQLLRNFFITHSISVEGGEGENEGLESMKKRLEWERSLRILARNKILQAGVKNNFFFPPSWE